MDGPQFIRANTKLLPVPLVPEIRLHLAEESLPIWRKTEEELGEMNVPPPYWAFAWAGGQALARYLIDNPGGRLRGPRARPRLGQRAYGHRGDAGRRHAGACRRHRCTGACGDRPQRCRQRRGRRGDAGGLAGNAAERGPAAASTSCSSAISSMSGRWPSACWPSSRRPVPTAQRSWSATRAAATSPRIAFARSPNTQVPVTRELEDAEIKRTAVWRLAA